MRSLHAVFCRCGRALSLRSLLIGCAVICDHGVIGQDMFDETFVAYRSDGREVVLCPGGATRQVTPANCREYCEKLLHMRMTETELQTRAVERGMADILPLPLLRLFSWEQVERLVCGRREIDLALLQRCTQYEDGLSAEAPRVVSLWKALDGLCLCWTT